MAKKEEAIKVEKKSEEEKKRIAQEQLKTIWQKEATIKAEQKNEVAKKK